LATIILTEGYDPGMDALNSLPPFGHKKKREGQSRFY